MKFIRFVGRACSDSEYTASVRSKCWGVCDRFTDQPNIAFEFHRSAKPITFRLSAEHQDFVDLATVLYVADQASARAASDDYWTRNQSFVVPVSNPDLWKRGTDALIRTLSYLTGDRYEFAWPSRRGLPSVVEHRRSLPREQFDVVCLFSGGLDSLTGAYRLLETGKRVLLVGHKSDNIGSSVQQELASELDKLFPRQSSLVQCLANSAKRESMTFQALTGVEKTHRVRSFLFLAVAICLAKAVRVEEIVLPENGLIALNAPLQVSRIGTLSTRTAHPIYLNRFTEFVRTTGLFGGSIRNPFLYESKTDLVAAIPTILHPLALASVSCAHPGRNAGYRNCGYCVACLYRRASLIELGIDDPSLYRHDVLTGLSALSRLKQQDFRALVAFAERVERTTPGERTRLVLANGSFPPDVGGMIGPSAAVDYSPWSDMLKRWADSFLVMVRRSSTPATLAIVGQRTSATKRAV
jgi:7-cyano-7-deazaguanine synthase in queuosine biosynthesis